MYKKLVNPTESKVSSLLQEGYTLHSVTSVITHFHMKFNDVNTDLVYHFIKEVQFNPMPQQYNFGIDWALKQDITCDSTNNHYNNPSV